MTEEEYRGLLAKLLRDMPRNVDVASVVREAERRLDLELRRLGRGDGKPRRDRAAYMREWRRRKKNPFE